MRITLFASLALLLVGASSYGQGTILFNNRTGSVDAPVRRPDGTGAGAGVTAGLFLVTESPGQVSLTPLFPTTTFRTTSAAAAFYLQQVTVEVPGHPAGSSVTVVMRNWDGPTYETSFWYGQSSPVTVVLGGVPEGGGAPLPPALLTGMQTFVLIPEPSTAALAVLGAAALLIRRRRG